MLLTSHLSCQFWFLRPSSVGGFRTTTEAYILTTPNEALGYFQQLLLRKTDISCRPFVAN